MRDPLLFFCTDVNAYKRLDLFLSIGKFIKLLALSDALESPYRFCFPAQHGFPAELMDIM